MKILLAEDEPPQRHALEALLREVWPGARLCASCADGLEALEAFEREQPQVVFLDIRMPGLNGLDVADAIAGSAHTVFITAYQDCAVRAFEQGAVDYILKPVSRERLALSVGRLQEKLRQSVTARVDTLIAQLRKEIAGTRPKGTLQWVTATVRETIRLYPIAEVLAFQAQDKYTCVLTAKEEAIIRTSLRELLASLDPEEFWHVHRSVIARAAAIDRITRDEAGKAWLALKGRNELLPVSGAFYGRLRGR